MSGSTHHEPNSMFEEPEPDDLIESRTPGATQKNWKTPSEFPHCPSEIDANALDEYRERLKDGEVFSRNYFGESKVVSLASDEPIRESSVTTYTRVKCKKCSSPLSRQYLHVIPSSCWKCGAAMRIALIDRENAIVGPREFSGDHVIIATERGALLKEKYSRTMGERYLSNTCPNCESMTGDFYLHHHYDPELRETGVPAGAICWSCKQREARAKQSIHHVPVSVEVAPGVWVEVDLRPTPEVGEVENGE